MFKIEELNYMKYLQNLPDTAWLAVDIDLTFKMYMSFFCYSSCLNKRSNKHWNKLCIIEWRIIVQVYLYLLGADQNCRN